MKKSMYAMKISGIFDKHRVGIERARKAGGYKENVRNGDMFKFVQFGVQAALFFILSSGA